MFQGEDSNFHLDRDFESMEELSESMSDDEEETQVIVDQSPYRFMNGNDGMGKEMLLHKIYNIDNLSSVHS